jgi:hypothetical protein
MLDRLVVLFLCGLGVYGEEEPGALPDIGYSLQWLVRRRGMVTGII